MLLPAALTFALMQPHIVTRVQTQMPNISQPDHVSSTVENVANSTGSAQINEEITTSDTVYVTKSGKKFHLADCYTIEGKNLIEYTRSEAEKQYVPCKVCKP